MLPPVQLSAVDSVSPFSRSMSIRSGAISSRSLRIYGSICGLLHCHPCVGGRVVSAEVPVKVFELSGDGNHRGVVGGERALWNERLYAAGLAIVSHGLAHSGVGRHAAADGYGLHHRLPGGLVELVDEYVDDGLLQGCGQVGLVLLYETRVGLYIVAQGVEE